jgi:hypothetical protein
LLAAKHSLPNKRSVPKRIRKLSHEDSSGERPAAIILQVSLTLPEGRQGYRRKYMKRCPRSRKVAGVLALSDPATHPQIPSCSLFFWLLQWIQHIFTLTANQTRSHSYCQAANPCRHRIYAQSLRVVRFGLRLAERAGFRTTAEYSVKW